MLYKLKGTSKACDLFDEWQESMIFSYLQNVMDKIFVTDIKQPESA